MIGFDEQIVEIESVRFLQLFFIRFHDLNVISEISQVFVFRLKFLDIHILVLSRRNQIFYRFEIFVRLERKPRNDPFQNLFFISLGINGKIGIVTDRGRANTQNTDAHGVNGANPHSFRAVSHHGGDSLFHFSCGFIRESDRKYVVGIDAEIGNKMSDTTCKNAGLSAARSRDHQYRAFRLHDGSDLFFV